MTSAVVGTKMTTRATSASSRVSRGALTIVNSGAGPKRVRSNAGTGATARECVGMNEMRARGVGRAVVVLMRDDRGRGTTRARGDDADRWMRGRENFFFNVFRGVFVDARGVASTGGGDESVDRAIATGPAYPREGG